VSRTNALQERKNRYLEWYKKTCVWRPEIGPKHFDEHKPEPGPNPGRPEKPGPTYNSDTHMHRDSQLVSCDQWWDSNFLRIGSLIITVFRGKPSQQPVLGIKEIPRTGSCKPVESHHNLWPKSGSQALSSAAWMRPKRPWPPPKQTCSDFSLVLNVNFNCSMPSGRRYFTYIRL